MKKIKNNTKKLSAGQLKIAEKMRKITQSDICSESLFNATVSVASLNNYDLDISTLCKNFSFQVDKIIKGDVRRIETMLATQAQTLDALFHKMLQCASNTELISKSQAYMDMAFKAQKQCRQTLSALTEIKHPHRATFIKQQNNAINQQVNNGIESEVKSESENLKKSKNIANELKEIIEAKNESVDTRTTIETIAVNSSVETVEVSRCENA